MIRVEGYGGPAEEWDTLVRSDPEWCHFHLHGWKRIMEEVFGHECPYLAARGENDELLGVLPLVRVRSLVFGDFLVSMPFLNYGGPLGRPPARKRLVAHAARLADEEGVDLLEVRSRHPLTVDLPVSLRKITVVRDLPEEAETLWDDLKSKVRSQVRRPMKAGMTVKFGPAEVEPYYRVFSRTMRDLGTPVMPEAFFRAMERVFPESTVFGCVYLDERPVAGGCGLRWGGELEMTWAGALREHSRQAPNMLLYWSFMERAIEDGCTLFNFGRCTPDGGTHRFKSQWGSRDEQLHWYRHAAGGRRKTPSPEDDRFSWGPRIWSRIPIPIANLLGPRVVKYIP